ncbi:transcription factor Adf-1-like [Trichoplusia ni]|uniref:Transcription factor Adf-1-like n=1 Tax=Trichoplusia ni TaxID=7111 RepID=A0A7E5W546_TRINI|nr:transcription factor Adf-1-like [Trichoplusia ni]
MDFSDSEEEKLINQVAHHPALYDASHKNYLNAIIKDNIWKNIGKVLNKSDEDCKKKWKSIRDSYHRFKKKNKLGTGSAALKKTKQNRHLQLLFLDNVPHHRTGGTNITPPQQELDVNNENVSVAEQEQGSDTTFPSNNNAEQSTTDQEVEVGTEATEVVPNVVKATTPKKKKKKKEDIFLTLWKQRDEQRQELYKNMVRKIDDDIDLFCKHIGEVLRNLPPYEKAKAKKHLGEVLSDYEIMAASHSSGRNTFSSPSNSTPSYRASSSELCTPSPPHSQHFVRSYTPLGAMTGSPELAGQGNAPRDFYLGAYSPINSAAPSPGPSGITSGLGYAPGPVHTSYPMSPEVGSPEPTDLSFQINQIDREEDHNFVDSVITMFK